MLFEIERSINGKTPEERLAVRRERSRPLIAELEIGMRQQRALLSTKNDTAKAINYSLNRWAADPLPRRRSRLLVKQRSRTRLAGHRDRKKELDLCGFGHWR
jgi:hypothetical protein